MKRTQWLLVAVAALIAVLVAAPAQAQTSSTTGAIQGKITDQNGNPLQGAKVTATSGRAPAVATTDSQGRYIIPNLQPGEYEIRVEKEGFGTIVQKEVAVNINSTRALPFVLTPGQVEQVTITAEAPLVDPKSVTTGGNFSVDKLVDQVPVGRNLAATLTLAPGVESGGGTGAGNYSISGSSGLENSYIVDGVNITNTGYGGIGSFNIVYGSLGTGVTYDFLEEVQVKTGGIDAEYGQATGGVVNTVVKSGTNDISGQVTLYAGAPINEYKQTSFFVGAVNNQKGSWGDNATYDLGLSLGGAMVKDKLFYFVAYNPVFTNETAALEDIPLPSSLADLPPPASYPSAVAGNQTRERKSDNYAAKLTWYANPNHRIELSAFGDPSSGDMGAQRFSLRNIDFADGGGLSEIDYGANNYTLKYDAVFTPNFFMQAQLGRHDGKFEEKDAVNKSRYTDQRQLRCYLSPALCEPGQARDNAATWAYGGVGFISNSTDINDQAKLSFTWVAGNNELKGGVQYDDIEYSDQQDYTGANIPMKFRVRNLPGQVGQTTAQSLATPCDSALGVNQPLDCYVLLDSRGGVVASLRSTGGLLQYRTTRGRYNPNPPPTTTKDLNIFLTDSYTFANRFTLKLGVRATQQKIEGAGQYTLGFYYDDGSRTDATAIRSAASGDPGSYKFDWAFAPRIGLSLDATGDGRSKVYASAGRYFERVPNDLAIRALSNEAGLGTTVFGDWDTAAGVPLSQTSYSSIRGGQTDIEAGTKLPYVDEFVLGWQQELGRDVSFEIRGIYRKQGRSLEDVQFNTVEATENYYAQYYLVDPTADPPSTIDTVPFPNDPAGVAGAPFGHYVLANPGENTSAGFPSAERKYYGLELILNKRFGDHWLFYGNMRFARLRGNYEGLFRNDNGQSDPNITSLFDFPNSPLLAGQFESGTLNTDRPYSLKLYGSYQWDNGLNLGAAFNWAAGTPRTPLLAHPNGFYQNSGEVPGINPTYYWYSTTNCTTDTYCLNTGSADAFFADTGAYATGSWTFPHLYTYDRAQRGYLGRTPDTASLDLSLSWRKQFNRWASIGIGATVFNVLNFRETTGFNDNVELQAGVTDPDFLKPQNFQDPRSLRVFVRYGF